jgi:hypothetical protein
MAQLLSARCGIAKKAHAPRLAYRGLQPIAGGAFSLLELDLASLASVRADALWSPSEKRVG